MPQMKKAIAYLNSETNYYPTLTELGYEDDANFLGWSETEGDTTTVYKPGDLIDNTATVRANNSVGKALVCSLQYRANKSGTTNKS